VVRAGGRPGYGARLTGPGSILAGRYRLERRLGEGAAGIVWLARDMRERGLVWAIKELDFDMFAPGERGEALDLFEREASMLMRLRHESLPRVVDRFTEQGREYLVMERVEGPTLDQILAARGGPLEEKDVIVWGVQLCNVLQYLHNLNPPVVYRDLKPSNVMVHREGGKVKLIDFGIARRATPTRKGDTAAYGTPGYAPPEQYAGHAEPRSDLYALGVTLYQLLTARDPQASGFKFRPARVHNRGVSELMEALLADCLQHETVRRPSSAVEVRERLFQAAAQQVRPWKKLLRRLFNP